MKTKALLYSVRSRSFATREEANAYAASESLNRCGRFVVRYDGFAVETYRAGKAVSA